MADHANAYDRILKAHKTVRSVDIDPKIMSTQPLTEILDVKDKVIARHEAEENLVKRIRRHIARLARYRSEVGKKICAAEDDNLQSKINRAGMLITQYNDLISVLKLGTNALTYSIYNLEMSARLHVVRIFAERLKRARKESGLTQNELADKLSMKRSTLAAYETGRNDPPILLILRLSKVLNRSADFFLGLTE